MQVAYEKFLSDPSRDNFAGVRELLVTGTGWPPRVEDLLAVADAAQLRRFRHVQSGCERLMPLWMLSPRAHYFSAQAAEALDERDLWQLELFQMQQCLCGLLATGDGSVTAPYACLYVTDCQDILTALGYQSRAQHAVNVESGCLDLVTCVDGAELWFAPSDLTCRVPSPRGRRAAAPVSLDLP